MLRSSAIALTVLATLSFVPPIVAEMPDSDAH